MFTPNNGQRAGVRVADSQLAPQSTQPDGTVVYAVACEMVATQYVDGGRTHEAVLLKVGNKIYYPPNAEQWAAALKEVSPWMFKGIQDKLNLGSNANVPKSDVVDIAASAVSKDLK